MLSMLRNTYRLFIVFLLIAMMAIIYSNLVVLNHKKFTYSEISTLPKENACLVLGTSKFLSNGNLNLFYQYRMDATVKHSLQVNVLRLLYLATTGEMTTMSLSK